MNRERLNQLKYMLENHDAIFNKKTKVQRTLEKLKFRKKPTNLKFTINRWHCGTAACALGSASLYAPFIEQGLCLMDTGLTGNDRPFYRGNIGFDAGSKFFDISELQSWFLFSPHAYALDTRTSFSKVATVLFNELNMPDYGSSFADLFKNANDVTPLDVVKRIDILLTRTHS